MRPAGADLSTDGGDNPTDRAPADGTTNDTSASDDGSTRRHYNNEYEHDDKHNFNNHDDCRPYHDHYRGRG